MERLPYTGMTLRRLLMLGSAAAQERDYSVIGNPVAFRTNLAKPLSSLLIPFTPIQSLNGQSAPYPPGGGKNLLNVTASTSTVNDVTYTIESDGTIKLSGTASARSVFKIAENFTLKAGTYKLNGSPQTIPVNCYLNFNGGGVSASETANLFDVSFTLTEDVTTDYVRFDIAAGTNTDGLVFKPMIRLATVTDATFAPYSNICPISGWTGVTAHRAGKNLIPYPYKVTSGTYSDVTYSINSDGTVNLHGTTSQTLYIDLYGNNTTTLSRLATLKNIGLNAGDTITLSSNFSGRLLFQFNKADGTLTSPSAVYSDNGATVTATIPSDAVYGYICLRVANGVTINQDNAWFMIQKGSTASPYTPYAGQAYPVTFPDGQTIYGGTLDATTGVLTVEWAYLLADGVNVKCTGQYGNGGPLALPTIIIANAAGISKANGVIASCFRTGANSSDVQNNGNTIILGNIGQLIAIHVQGMQGTDGSQGYNSMNELRAAVNGWLEENPTQICYKLATPIVVQLDPVTVQTLIGDNVIFSDTNGQNTVTYKKKG